MTSPTPQRKYNGAIADRRMIPPVDRFTDLGDSPIVVGFITNNNVNDAKVVQYASRLLCDVGARMMMGKSRHWRIAVVTTLYEIQHLHNALGVILYTAMRRQQRCSRVDVSGEWIRVSKASRLTKIKLAGIR